MTMSRRAVPLRRLFALCLLTFCVAMPALAQGHWPTRPVKLILPYAPGGSTDLIARPWAERLQQAFGQPFVLDNRGGASGAIGTEAAARSTPDGYTFLLTPGATLTVLPLLRKVGYDTRKDFVRTLMSVTWYVALSSSRRSASTRSRNW